MNHDDAPDLTRAVLESFAGAVDPRTRDLLASLIRSLHGFVRETRPTEAEWLRAIDFLTRTGQMCDDRRQEFILLSDVLGVSMLVDAINHAAGDGATESTVMGPFFVENAPDFALGGDIAQGVAGEPLLVSGVVRSSRGDPIAGAVLDVWQSDDDGHYDVQLAGQAGPRLRGRFRSDAEGRYWFWSILPASYPVPTDGPVGELLRAASRQPFRPAHVHFMASAEGFQRLVTHVFVAGDPHLASDAVFGVKDSLVRQVPYREGGSEPNGTPVARRHRRLAFDIVLRPGERRRSA